MAYPANRGKSRLFAPISLHERSPFISTPLPRTAHAHLLTLAVARLARAGLALVRATHDRRAVLVGGEAVFLLLERADLVAQVAGFLEFEIGGGGAHLLLQLLDVRTEVVADHMRTVIVDLDRDLVALRHVDDDVADVATNRRRRDAVGLDVGDLLLAPAIGFIARALHRAGHAIGVADHAPVDVARGAADGLDQRGLGAQEALLVGVEDADQSALGD